MTETIQWTSTRDAADTVHAEIAIHAPAERVFELSGEGGVTTVRLTHSGLVTEGDRAGNNDWADVLAGLRWYVEQHASA